MSDEAAVVKLNKKLGNELMLTKNVVNLSLYIECVQYFVCILDVPNIILGQEPLKQDFSQSKNS